MKQACRLRELREARGPSLSEIVAELPKGDGHPKIYRGDLSRLERGPLLPPDEWVPLFEGAYGAPEATW